MGKEQERLNQRRKRKYTGEPYFFLPIFYYLSNLGKYCNFLFFHISFFPFSIFFPKDKLEFWNRYSLFISVGDIDLI
jgi:hypothetical protein